MSRVFVSAVAAAGLASVACGQSLWFTGTRTSQVWQANADGSGAPSVLYDNAAEQPSGPTGIDVNPLTGELYWGTGSNGTFWSGNVNGSGAGFFADASDIFDQALGTAVDPATGRIFLMNDTVGLFSINPDGTGLTDLGFAPRRTKGVEFDAFNNRVLVSQQFVGIFAVAPDGSSSTQLLEDLGNGARDIATTGDRIFWVDLDSVWSANADGSDPQVIADAIDGGLLRTVDALGDTLYVGEFNGANDDTIWTIDLNTGAESVLYQGAFGGIRGVTVIPAPAALALLGVGGVAAARRRR